MLETKKERKRLFEDPFAFEKCADCGKTYQAGNAACPRCGKKNPHPNRAIPFDKTRMMNPFIEIIAFLIGWLGLQFAAKAVNRGLELWMPELDPAYVDYLMILNYLSYFIIFVALVSLTAKYLPNLLKTLFSKDALRGFWVILAMYAFNIVWNTIAKKLGADENINEKAVNLLIMQSPILAIVFTGIIAPFCEEMTYRAGMFAFGRRINRVLAYVFASIVFGCIHMHDFTSLNEWLNLPPYVFAGLSLSYAYDKWGLGASLLAHVTNNVLAVLMTLLIA